MKKLFFISTLSSIIFTVMVMLTCHAQALEKISGIPDAFQNKKDAIENQCHIANLKGDKKRPVCVLQKFEEHELRLITYDSDENGRFVKAKELCIPSWYQKAKVKFKELSNTGQQFIFVTFEGNTGTGTLQTILMIIGWHDGKYMPVLAETIDYYIMERDESNSLKMSYKIDNIKTQNVSLKLKYKYTAKDRNEIPSQCKASWADVLKWNEKAFSFYDEQEEHSKIKNTSCVIQKNISNVRLMIHDTAADRLCTDFFDKTKIMYILE
jgi:hypothetical protein